MKARTTTYTLICLFGLALMLNAIPFAAATSMVALGNLRSSDNPTDGEISYNRCPACMDEFANAKELLDWHLQLALEYFFASNDCQAQEMSCIQSQILGGPNSAAICSAADNACEFAEQLAEEVEIAGQNGSAAEEVFNICIENNDCIQQEECNTQQIH